MSAAESVGIVLVRGIELSTDNQGQSQHLLASRASTPRTRISWSDWSVGRARGRSVSRAPVSQAGRARGLPVSAQHVRAASGDGSTGRPHIADAMVRAGHVSDRKEAFDRYLAEGRPAYVPDDKLSFEDAITLVSRRLAGCPSWPTHEVEDAIFTPQRFEELQSLGLGGIEVDHEEHDARPEQVPPDRVSPRHGRDRAVSDYHGDGKKGHPLGCNTTSPQALERLLGDRIDLRSRS